MVGWYKEIVPQIKRKDISSVIAECGFCPRFFYVNEGDEKSLESI